MSTGSFNTFADRGYLVLKGFLDSALIEKLSPVVERIHAQWLRENHAEYIQRLLVKMHSLTSRRYFEGDADGRIDFFEHIAPRKLTTLLDDMFGGGIYFHNTQLFFNPFENRRLPYWHRDMQYSSIDDARQAAEQGNMTSLHVRLPLVKEAGV